MKILFVAEYYHPIRMGGAEVCLHQLVEELLKHDVQITILTPNYESYSTTIEKKGKLEVIRFRSFRNFLYKKRKGTQLMYHKTRAIFELVIGFYMRIAALELRHKTKKYLKHNNPDVIHANNVESMLALSKLRTKIPRVVHIRDLRIFSVFFKTFGNLYQKDTVESIKHSMHTNCFMAWLLKKFITEYRIANLRRFDHYIAINNYVKECTVEEGIRSDKIAVINDATDDGTISKLSKQAARKKLKIPDKTTVLFVGALVELKGAHFLPRLIKRNPDLHFVVLGNGPLKESITKLPNVEVKYMSPKKVMDYYKACDILVFPQTIHAGYGKVAIEAQKSGIPIVYFDAKGIDEIIEHKKTGMFAKFNDAEDLNKQLHILVKDKVLRSSIANNAKIGKACYNIDFIAKQFIKLCLRIK